MFNFRKITDLESIEKSEAFCMKPWVHLFVSQFGTVVPCCLTSWEKDQALGDVNEESIQEIWNGTEMKRFRRKMMADKPDSRCHQCYENEKNGLKSKRNIVNFLYADKIDWVLETNWRGHSPTSKPIYWDLRISISNAGSVGITQVPVGTMMQRRWVYSPMIPNCTGVPRTSISCWPNSNLPSLMWKKCISRAVNP